MYVKIENWDPYPYLEKVYPDNDEDPEAMREKEILTLTELRFGSRVKLSIPF